MGELQKIKGIGPKIEKMLEGLGVNTLHDLLLYFPRDYEKFDKPVNIIDLKENEVRSIEGFLFNNISTFKKGRFMITTVDIYDGSSKIKAYWFNNPYTAKTLVKNLKYVFRGRITRYGKNLIFTQPKVYKLEEYNKLIDKLSPVYPLTKGLSNLLLKKAIKGYLDERKVDDAIYHMHFPVDYNDMLNARNELVYEEFLDFSKKIIEKKTEKQFGNVLLKNAKFSENDYKLDYKLTNDQINAINDVIKDFNSGYRVNRLIEGDVGSGKSIVAFIIAMIVIKLGMQVVIMAPTETLAEQHYENFLKLDKNVVLLTGKLTASKRKEVLDGIKNGDAKVIIGTHALFSSDVKYKNLSIAIIDEEQRFGVKEKENLLAKGKDVGFISMSATPIPRALAMYLYAGMDVSYIKEKPKDRIAIKNCVATFKDREKAYKAIKKEIGLGHQAYVVCPAIEKTDDEDIGSFCNFQNVTEYTKVLKDYFGKDIKIEKLHGKLSSDKKLSIMNDFKDGKIDILVSTTVIEVGVDNKNATFIMIEDAGRFGLAELHQLRGRVGRGKDQSYALFIDTTNSEISKKRLDVLLNSNDGFYIAEKDLKLRGPGDIFGIRQSGDMRFRLANIYTDYEVFKKAYRDAIRLSRK